MIRVKLVSVAKKSMRAARLREEPQAMMRQRPSSVGASKICEDFQNNLKEI